METVSLRNDDHNEKLTEFQIGIMINDGRTTDALYANGKQQCKVFIKTLKEVRANKESSWHTAPLSASERDSIAVLPYSNELEPDPATGWDCDATASDKYDEGLWRGTASVGLRGSPSTTSVGANVAMEEFYRYMRFNGKQAPIRPTTFMACITLDGGRQYTTHFDDGDKGFESSITISPQSPYSLHVNDLMFNSQDAYSGDNGNIKVKIYYWALPGGLRIVQESFNGTDNSNDKLVYAYAIRDGNKFRLGMAIRHNVMELNLKKIDSLSTGTDAQIPLIKSDCMLRGARYYADNKTTNQSNYNNLLYWTITDNYGCESTFVLKANDADKGETLELLNG